MLQNTVGIVSEFNPFHYGHQYLIRKTREQYGENTGIVCVMSGDFVQRGEAACFSKYARAEAACRSGADLVLELPLPWCCSSAEAFASAALGIMNGLGAVSAISFGSECGDAGKIRRAAEVLLSPEMEDALRQQLQQNKNYASARQAALASLSEELAEIIGTPNNILAVEYAKAIIQSNAEIALFTVSRTGAAHDSFSDDGYRSAREIREMMIRDPLSGDWYDYVPKQAAAVFRREIQQGRGPVNVEALESAILSRLRLLTLEDIMNLPETDGGIGELFYRSVQSTGSLEALVQNVKHKSIALSRVRRLVTAGALGIRKDMGEWEPDYIRVLAFNGKGRQILHDASPSLPIITKTAHMQRGNTAGTEQFELGSCAHDLFVLGFQDSVQRVCGEDWRTGPVIVKGE